MRQLITRMDDETHRRLKECAARRGRSMNDLVIEAIGVVIELDDRGSGRRSTLRSCLRERGLLVERTRVGGAPSLDSVREQLVDVGPSADELLAWVKGD